MLIDVDKDTENELWPVVPFSRNCGSQHSFLLPFNLKICFVISIQPFPFPLSNFTDEKKVSTNAVHQPESLQLISLCGGTHSYLIFIFGFCIFRVLEKPLVLISNFIIYGVNNVIFLIFLSFHICPALLGNSLIRHNSLTISLCLHSLIYLLI